MDISIGNRSEATGRFNFVRGVDGDIMFDDTEAHAVVTSAVEHKNSWWFDFTHGSDLHTVKNLTESTPSQVEAMVLESESSLEAEGAIDKVSVVAERDTTASGLGRLDVRIRWTTPSGHQGDETVGG